MCDTVGGTAEINFGFKIPGSYENNDETLHEGVVFEDTLYIRLDW